MASIAEQRPAAGETSSRRAAFWLAVAALTINHFLTLVRAAHLPISLGELLWRQGVFSLAFLLLTATQAMVLERIPVRRPMLFLGTALPLALLTGLTMAGALIASHLAATGTLHRDARPSLFLSVAVYWSWVALAWAGMLLAWKLWREADQTNHRRSSRPVARGTELWAVDRGRRIRIPTETISHITANGDYAMVHTNGRVHMLYDSLRALEDRLGQADFLRVHRSSIVRASAIAAIERRRGGSLVIVLTSGERVPVSRPYGKAVHRLRERTD